MDLDMDILLLFIIAQLGAAVAYLHLINNKLK